MKVGIIIPDRGDRPEFTKNCLRMVDTMKACYSGGLFSHNASRQIGFYHVIDPATSDKPDITVRYKKAYDAFRGKKFDCLLFIENDDWYSPDYISIMIDEWIKRGKPDFLGHTYTVYFHLKLQKHFTFHHFERSSAMNTLIKPDLDLQWPADEDPYTDLFLWQQTTLNHAAGAPRKFVGEVFTPHKHICLGIKHGVGLCGGANHTTKLHRYTHDNIKLIDVMDYESYKFYSNYFNQ
jgi:hypothetical protein